MNEHIDKILIDYNSRAEALQNEELVQHTRSCKRCNEIFERYFSMIEGLQSGLHIVSLSEKDKDEIFNNITSIKPTKQTSNIKLIKVIAIAASIIIILIGSIFYLTKSNNLAMNYKNIIHQLSNESKDDMEIITEFELFSNLEMIEHIDEIEEIKEVLDDEI